MRIGLEVLQFFKALTDPTRYMFSVGISAFSNRASDYDVPPKTVDALTLNSTDTVGAMLVKQVLGTDKPVAPQLADV